MLSLLSVATGGIRCNLQGHGPVLEPPCCDGRHLGLPQFLHFLLAPGAAMGVEELVLKLLHLPGSRHLTGAGER